MDPKSVVAFFRSDHHFSDDEAFIGHIESADDAAASRPEMVILLGILPETPEVEYGWIEPGIPLGSPLPSNICRVNRFWEKPSWTLASALMERCCLWNSFVMVGHVQAFLNLIRHALPRLIEAFESIRSSFFTAYERPVLSDLYLGIRAPSFSQDVLSVQPNGLAVLRATGLGWSDLGEPGRVLSVLERKGVQTDWGSNQATETGGLWSAKRQGRNWMRGLWTGGTGMTPTQIGRLKLMLETRLRELS